MFKAYLFVLKSHISSHEIWVSILSLPSPAFKLCKHTMSYMTDTEIGTQLCILSEVRFLQWLYDTFHSICSMWLIIATTQTRENLNVNLSIIFLFNIMRNKLKSMKQEFILSAHLQFWNHKSFHGSQLIFVKLST